MMISVRSKDLRNSLYYVGNIMHEGTVVKMKTEMEGICGGMHGAGQKKGGQFGWK
jgi:hypothetical protein